MSLFSVPHGIAATLTVSAWIALSAAAATSDTALTEMNEPPLQVLPYEKPVHHAVVAKLGKNLENDSDSYEDLDEDRYEDSEQDWSEHSDEDWGQDWEKDWDDEPDLRDGKPRDKPDDKTKLRDGKPRKKPDDKTKLRDRKPRKKPDDKTKLRDGKPRETRDDEIKPRNGKPRETSIWPNQPARVSGTIG